MYYAVREDFNCRDGERFLEPDERILPAVDFLAATDAPPDSPYICRTSIDALCRALHRRGRLQDLRRIPWLRVESANEREAV